MFSIPYTFVNPAEDYITLPALKRFVKELENDELRTTIDRPAIIKEIEDFANQSPENEELVLEWLDQVVVEGIKDIQIKYLNSESYTSVLDDDNLIMGILEPKIICQDKRHVNGVYDKELSLLNYKIVNDSKTGKSIKLYLGKILNTFYKGVSNAVIYYPIFIELYIDIGIIVARAKSKANLFKYMVIPLTHHIFASKQGRCGKLACHIAPPLRKGRGLGRPLPRTLNYGYQILVC